MDNNVSSKELQAPSSGAIDKINFFNPEHIQTIQRAANLFMNSELVPDIYKVSEKNPKEKAMANCIIALDMANRIGASALMVMQNLIIIYGRPSWSSKFLVATVNTCGRFEPLKYKFEDLGELKDVEYIEYEWQNGSKKAVTKKYPGVIKNISCYAYTTAKGSEELLEGSPISIEMAIKEGWYTKNGSKWKTMPRQMLMYRAASFWTSAYAPDLSMGMKTEFEAIDIEEANYTEVPNNEDNIKEEIENNANKELIDFETGEIKEEEPAIKATPKSEVKKPAPAETVKKNIHSASAGENPGKEVRPGNGKAASQSTLGPDF